jgi:hypothetical protein
MVSFWVLYQDVQTALEADPDLTLKLVLTTALDIEMMKILKIAIPLLLFLNYKEHLGLIELKFF